MHSISSEKNLKPLRRCSRLSSFFTCKKIISVSKISGYLWKRRERKRPNSHDTDTFVIGYFIFNKKDMISIITSQSARSCDQFQTQHATK